MPAIPSRAAPPASAEEPSEQTAVQQTEEFEEETDELSEEEVNELTEESTEGPIVESTAFEAAGASSVGVVTVFAEPGVFPAGAKLIVSDPAPARRMLMAARSMAGTKETVVASYSYEITVTARASVAATTAMAAILPYTAAPSRPPK